MSPVAVHMPVAGSYSSAEDSARPLPAWKAPACRVVAAGDEHVTG